MPIYEYDCPVHGRFENINFILEADKSPCPDCGLASKRVPSRIGIIRVHHAPIPDQNDSLRVHDRQRMMKDTAVKKALSDYKESQRYSKESPYNSMEVNHA